MKDTTSTTAQEFQREVRYLVIKISKLGIDDWSNEKIKKRILKEVPDEALVTAVVVESDWPEYEKVWAMIQARMADKTEVMEQKPVTPEYYWELDDGEWTISADGVNQYALDSDRREGDEFELMAAVTLGKATFKIINGVPVIQSIGKNLYQEAQ